MKYSEIKVDLKYTNNLENASRALRNLDFASDSIVNFKGLNGWVFEQTIRQCLMDELRDILDEIAFNDQEKLTGRATVDLVVGRVAIEIKSGGLFSDESEKYTKWRVAAYAMGWDYLYITLDETHLPFKESAKKVFGYENTFFLNDPGSWSKFVNRVVELNTVG
jgi:hypothetical protein